MLRESGGSIILLKLHLVYLLIGGDVEQVIAIGSILVHVSIVIERVRRAALALVNQSHRGLPSLVVAIRHVIVSGSLYAVGHVEGGVAQLWVVGVAIGIVVSPVALSHRRGTIVHALRLGPGIAGHQVESKIEMLLGLQREVYGITLGGIAQGVDVGEIGARGHAGEHGSVVPSVSIGIAVSIARHLISEVLVKNVVQGLGIDGLGGPIDAQYLEIETQVEPQVLRELEVLVVNVHRLAATSLQQSLVLALLVGVEQQGEVISAIGAVGGELDTRVGEIVAYPHKGDTACEYSDSTTQDEAAIVVDVPTEAYTRTPHGRAGKPVVCLYVPSLLGRIGIERCVLSGSVGEDRHIHAQTISKLEVLGSVPFVLRIEAQLHGREASLPTRVSRHVGIGVTITILVDILSRRGVASHISVVIVLEITIGAEIIAAEEVLDEEVGEMEYLVVGSESESVVAPVPSEVVLYGVDILV